MCKICQRTVAALKARKIHIVKEVRTVGDADAEARASGMLMRLDALDRAARIGKQRVKIQDAVRADVILIPDLPALCKDRSHFVIGVRADRFFISAIFLSNLKYACTI